MGECIDISESVKAICGALGLEYEFVGQLSITPASVVITPASVVANVYLKDENGAKFVNEKGELAREDRTFEVST